MNVAYIGNFDPSHSTETHVAKALENIGHQVRRIAEQRLEWLDLPRLTDGCDFMLWTRTGGFAPPDKDRQRRALEAVQIPKVGYHLDRWWGLARETTENGPRDPNPDPFFTHLDLLCTADGGDHPWAVRHIWFPPGVSGDEAVDGTPQVRFKADVGFVGNLINYGHLEWQPYRRQLAEALRKKYGGRFRVFPEGGKQIRGRDLADLYASVKVLVGDSCLVGNPARYWSDRIPETTGRGGFLIHPDVIGLPEQHPHLWTYTLGDIDELLYLIDLALNTPDLRQLVAGDNAKHTRENHTYERRMERLVAIISGQPEVSFGSLSSRPQV